MQYLSIIAESLGFTEYNVFKYYGLVYKITPEPYHGAQWPTLSVTVSYTQH